MPPLLIYTPPAGSKPGSDGASLKHASFLPLTIQKCKINAIKFLKWEYSNTCHTDAYSQIKPIIFCVMLPFPPNKVLICALGKSDKSFEALRGAAVPQNTLLKAQTFPATHCLVAVVFNPLTFSLSLGTDNHVASRLMLVQF